MKAILVDTGPLYALVDPDDQHHRRAREEQARLADGGLTLIVSFPIVMEAYTLILRNLGNAVAHAWLSELLNGVSLLNPTPEDHLKAAERVRRYPDQTITLFDALVATLAEELRIPVWTYDFHFDVLRVEVWR